MHRLPDAIAETLDLFVLLGAERVPLSSATGRRLARDMVARRPLPPYDASAMDGYAVRAEDVRAATSDAPCELSLAFSSPAGRPSDQSVGEGQAARVLTGSAVPKGADCVVIQEDVSIHGSKIHVRFAVKPRANIRHEGSDLVMDSVYLAKGSRLDAGAIAILASQDVAMPEVRRRPVVAILPTGDELRAIGDPETYGSIVDSNAPMLASLVEREGGIPRILPIVGDSPDAIANAIGTNLDVDLVISTGGVSVGDHDYLPDALGSLGATIRFRKVRMKPGKPVTVAEISGTPFVGLPGNPASAMVGFELFVVPGLRAMQGDSAPFAAGEMVPLLHPLRRSMGRPELARGRLVPHLGHHAVDLTRSQGSGSLVALMQCDVLALFSADTGALEAGTPVFCLPFGGPGSLAMSPLARRVELEDPPRG